jgi:hypothetical protein
MALGRRTVAIKHRSAGTNVDGNYVPGSLTDDTIEASVQPLKPMEVEHLPEGRRERCPFWVITDALLELGSSDTPDFVVIGEALYEVESREDWQNGIINHYKYMVLRVIEA